MFISISFYRHENRSEVSSCKKKILFKLLSIVDKTKLHVIFCTIWYHLYNFKNLEKTDGRVLLLVKLLVFNFTKSSTPPSMFFTFFKLYKWYQIAQRIMIISRVVRVNWPIKKYKQTRARYRDKHAGDINVGIY